MIDIELTLINFENCWMRKLVGNGGQGPGAEESQGEVVNLH